MRLFVALHLEEATRAELARAQSGLRSLDRRDQVRWVDPAGVHLTLRFLGEVPEPRVADLVAELARVAPDHPPPAIGLGDLGAFPSHRDPRVVWIGLRESGSRLDPLQRAVEAAVRRFGWPPEDRPFQPHLTLGRARDGRGRLAPELRAALDVPLQSHAARTHDRLALVRSHLSSPGSRYEDVATWRLGAGRSDRA